MTRVIISPSADADLDAILNDLTKATGARRRGLGKDIRIGIVFPYILIYRHSEADDTVKVLRVIHGRRNITAKSISD